MTLLQQFLITLSLPLALLWLLAYSWRDSARRDEPYLRYWLLALLVLTLWASSILSFYIGTPFPQEVAFTWRVLGRHMLSLFAVLLLLTTIEYMDVPSRQGRLLLGLGLGLWLLAIVADPALTPFELPSLAAGGQPISHFMLWASIWVSSWLVSLLAAWIVAWKSSEDVPRSLYRNRVNYWLLSLTLFLLGGSLALIQQPEQPVWQEVAALGQILAAFVGANSLIRNDLPDLRLTLRHLGARLASSLLIFALTWLVLWYAAYNIPRRAGGSSMLDLIFLAAIFAALFMATNRFVRLFVRRIFLPSTTAGETIFANQPDLADSLLQPDALATVALRLVQANLSTEEAHVFLAEDGPGGSVILRPLASENAPPPTEPLSLADESPLTVHLRRTPAIPLYAYDVQNLDVFEAIPEKEMEGIARWQYQLLFALQAGRQLVGLLVLGEKYTGAPYTTADTTWLQMMAAQVGPLLLQARHLRNLERVNRHVFDELQTSTQERQYLKELSALYAHFSQLASPELRVPLASLNQEVQLLQNGEEGPNVETLKHQLAQLRLMVDHLIVTADRLQQQRSFVFATIRLDDAINQAVRNLTSMAEARRVTVEIETDPRLPSIQGDEQRLIEAIQYLIHNAIKFNKIGGKVRIECAPAGNELYLHVHDTGVGIPEQRLRQIWTEFGRRQNGFSRSTSPGLGLLLTRFIVRAHGGRVEAQSRYGAGSTFTIYLPLVLDRQN